MVGLRGGPYEFAEQMLRCTQVVIWSTHSRGNYSHSYRQFHCQVIVFDYGRRNASGRRTKFRASFLVRYSL